MPNYFQFHRKQKGKKAGEVVLPSKVDEEICQHLNRPVDPEHYCANWYDTIGLALATGLQPNSKKMKEIFKDSELALDILSFMHKHYVVSAWYSSVRM